MLVHLLFTHANNCTNRTGAPAGLVFTMYREQAFDSLRILSYPCQVE